jgi:hypothetical protein
MSDIKPVDVGASDPELKTSPILEEMDEEYEVLAQEVEDHAVCWFNSASYNDGSYVCSSSRILLRCDKGIWVRKGSCDPGNP